MCFLVRFSNWLTIFGLCFVVIRWKFFFFFCFLEGKKKRKKYEENRKMISSSERNMSRVLYNAFPVSFLSLLSFNGASVNLQQFFEPISNHSFSNALELFPPSPPPPSFLLYLITLLMVDDAVWWKKKKNPNNLHLENGRISGRKGFQE